MFEDDEDIDGQATAIRQKPADDMWDLARYVEEHPEDHAERWRLAKKMYLSWEYRHALEHLSVLKNEWTTRINVVRYLSATYYRLGRYDEAMAELEEAIDRWPEDIGVREQLARVKEIAGDRHGASAVWEKIAGLNPGHPTAQSAIRRLETEKTNSPKEDLGIGDSDSGVDMKMGMVCPQCGAQNSVDEPRCWQCNEVLRHVSPAPQRRSGKNALSPVAMGPSIESLVTVTGFVGVVFACFCIYLSLFLMMGGSGDTEQLGYRSLWDLYTHGMARTRLALGAALYLGWPFALWTAINYFRIPLRVPPAFVTLSAFAAAGLAYLCTWLPENALWLFFVLPPLGTALLVIGAFQIPPRQAVSVWGMHLGIMALLIPMTLLVAERVQYGRFFNPLADIPGVMSFLSQQSAEEEDAPGRLELADADVPIAQKVRWSSTGSEWLDARAGKTSFTVTSGDYQGLIFEIQDSGGTRLYEDVKSEVWSASFPVKPGETYTLYVRGPAGVKASLEIGGLMPCAAQP